MPGFRGDWGGEWEYSLDELLGEPGGFGAVHPGEGSDGTPVAVKVIPKARHPGAELPTQLHQRERDVVEKLRGQEAVHLVRVHDVALVGDDLLIVMELAEGTLAGDVGVLAEGDVVEVLQQVVAGLRELHEVGIIHRDLKPSNILRLGDTWKLADFGISRDVDVGTGDPTFVGAGTPPYIAPELWSGTASPTVRSDLYALGCIGFELLNGDPPFTGPGLEDFKRQHLQGEVPALDQGSSGLKAIITRLLRKEPNERYQDVRAVEERLTQLVAPLSEAQERLQLLALTHSGEVAREEAQAAAELAEWQRRHDLRTQALADLADICEDAASLLRDALDVEYLRTHRLPMHRFWFEHGEMEVKTWTLVGPASESDPLVVAGAVCGTNRRLDAERVLLMANVVCEIVDDRLMWRLYRFERDALVRTYSLGPDSPHGFEQVTFEQQRPYMLGGGRGIWTLAKTELTPEALVALFEEVLQAR